MKKIKKNNLWNRIFYRTSIRIAKNQLLQAQLQIQNSPRMLERIRNSKGDFYRLYFAHQEAASYTLISQPEAFHTFKIGYSDVGIKAKTIINWLNDSTIVGTNSFGIEPDLKRDVVLQHYFELLYAKVTETELNAHKLIHEMCLLGY